MEEACITSTAVPADSLGLSCGESSARREALSHDQKHLPKSTSKAEVSMCCPRLHYTAAHTCCLHMLGISV